MRTLLSLFDHTGTWSAPFWDAGWNVIQIDLQHGNDVNDFDCEHLMDLTDGQTVDGMLIAPPCDNFTCAGARWWNDKDQAGKTETSAELVRQSLRAVEFLKPDFWALENPPGRLPQVVPWFDHAPRYFDPCDFSGWLPMTKAEQTMAAVLKCKGDLGQWDSVTPEEVELTKRLNLYTKKTGLWGHFPDLVQKRREPLNVCKAGSWLMKLGGKSLATKNARSATPEGFALAFFDAVHDYALDWDAIDEGTAEYHSFQES